MRKRILILGRSHPVLPRVVAHYVEKRYEVLFGPQPESDLEIDFCVVCQSSNLGQVHPLMFDLLSIKHIPAILITDAALYNGNGPPPTKSKRGMNELMPVIVEDRDNQVAQLLLESQFKKSSSPRLIMRLFDVYGPGILAGVIPEWITQCRANHELVYDCDVQRTFLYVDDFLSALTEFERRLQDIQFDALNVGATEMISLSRLGEYIWTLTYGQDEKVAVRLRDSDDWGGSLPLDGQYWRLPNIRRVQGFTGWSPTTSLRQGLFHTIDYMSKH